MNKLIFLYIALFVIYSCKTKKVTPIEVAQIKTTFVVRSGSEIKNKEEHFDSLGNCIKEIYFGSRPGDTISIVENSYAVTLLLQSIEKNRSGQIQQTTINHYDNTYLSQKIVIRYNDTMLIQSYTYHDNGNLKREITEFPQGKTTPIINIRNYDKKGNPETIYDQIYEDSSMIVLGRYEMTSYNNIYDTSSNRLIKVVATKLFGYYEMPDTLFEKTFNYDNKGNLIAEKYFIKISKDAPDSITYNYSGSEKCDNKISYFSSLKNSVPIILIDTTFYLYDAFDRLIFERSSLSGIGYKMVYTK